MMKDANHGPRIEVPGISPGRSIMARDDGDRADADGTDDGSIPGRPPGDGKVVTVPKGTVFAGDGISLDGRNALVRRPDGTFGVEPLFRFPPRSGDAGPYEAIDCGEGRCFRPSGISIDGRHVAVRKPDGDFGVELLFRPPWDWSRDRGPKLQATAPAAEEGRR
jgi:hypothetical protein